MEGNDRGNVWFLESLDTLHRAIHRADDLEATLNRALEAVLEIFECDRAWLIDVHGSSWTPVMERTRPEYPGGLQLGVTRPYAPERRRVHQRVLEADWCVQVDPAEVSEFATEGGALPPQSILALAIHPRPGAAWLLGIHQCSYARSWRPEEERVFVEIGHRLADALTSLLTYRELRENEQRLVQAQRVARLGYWEREVATFEVKYSDEVYRIFGLSPTLRALETAKLAERLHPDDRHIMIDAYERAIAGGPRYDVDYRVLRPDGEVRYVHSEGDIISDAEGRPLRMFGTLQDITERKLAEERLVRYRDALAGLAREQEALRRVATLVARAASAEEVFVSVTEEAGRLLDVDLALLARCDGRSETIVAGWGRSGPVGGLARTPIASNELLQTICRTGRPARIESFDDRTGPAAEMARAWGLTACVGVPITVEGEIRAVMYAASTSGRSLPADTEGRLASFTELLATAYANAEAREALRQVADEQAALRRVATLVARGEAPGTMFAAVAREVAQLQSADLALVGRYETDASFVPVGAWSRAGEPTSLGERLPLGGSRALTHVLETARAARFDVSTASGEFAAEQRDRGMSLEVAAPITVAGHLWGAIHLSAQQGDAFPEGTEDRLADFTDLVATAVANAQTQTELTASRARIVTTADQTRRRIERDLHDGAQQQLVSLALLLRAARSSVPAELGELASELDRIGAGLDRAQRELQEFARGIHPAILNKAGLARALQALAGRSPLPVELTLHVAVRLPEPIEIAAYYVISELHTNALKHAQASHLAIELASDDHILTVRVRDDGIGGATFARGSGLLGLKDRVEALGGRIELHSPVGAGTSVSVELPRAAAAAGTAAAD